MDGHCEEPNGALTAAPAEDCGSYTRRPRSCIPLHYRAELVELVKLAGPVVISQLMFFMVGVISVVFCGHLGKTELAAVSLAAAVINITGISIGTGLSSTCDTLISQTYGSGNLKRVGVILQRGILILLLACFPCWAILINTEPLLLAIKQSPEVASCQPCDELVTCPRCTTHWHNVSWDCHFDLSQLYVEIFMPALPAVFMYQLEGKYLQNQGIMWPQVITGVIGNILNVIINYIFLYPLELGIAGSAAANAISQYLLALLLYAYIWWRGLHKATWGGWSLDCLQEWGPFVKLAIPSMLMMCLSWWIFEIGGFLAGVISEVELGAQSIAYQLSITIYMFPSGFSAAASVRVGNALGAGNIEQAKLSCKVPIVCTFFVACFIGACLSISRHVIGYIFTSEQDIIHRLADVMLIFGFMHTGDATAGVSAAALRGAGKQLIGALCNLVGFYFIGFPIGVSLMFAANMGIVGLWTGLTICVSLQATVFITILYKLDWKKAAEEALVRAGVQNTEGKEMVHLEQTYSNQSQGRATTDLSGEDDLEEHDSGLSQLQTARTTVGDVLSIKQLVLRRGLALLIMIFILIAGIVTSVLLLKLLR